MILAIKAYIKSHAEVSTQDIQNHFDIDENTLEGLLRPLLKQGHIQKISGAHCDSSCATGCRSGAAKTLLRWTSQARPNLLLAIEVH